MSKKVSKAAGDPGSAADTAKAKGGRVAPLNGVTVGNVSGQPQQMTGAGPQAGSASAWFGPGVPLNPVAPRDVAGRQLDYQVSYNTDIQPRSYSAISFAELRNLADAYDLLRLIIETRKDQIEAFDFEVVPMKGKTVSDAEIEAAKEFLEYPDKEHQWNTWLRMILEDLLVIDAVAVYPRKTRGGDLYSLDLIDGATIKRVLDQYGRTPTPGVGPAYQQVLHGLPAVDYTQDELIYTMRNARTANVYGYSPVEQVIMTVNIALRRQISQLQFYTEGNIPEAIAGVPDTWSMDTIQQFQTYWDTMMEGNTAARRHMKFVPLDASKMYFPKDAVLKDQFDEWLARIICFAFSIPATPLVKEMNRSVAESSADAAHKEGLIPLLNWLKKFLDRLLHQCYGNKDLEFKWVIQKELAPLDQAQVDQIYLQERVVTKDEVRAALGKPEFTPEQKAAMAPPPAPTVPGMPNDSKPALGGKGGRFGKPNAAPFGKPAAKPTRGMDA